MGNLAEVSASWIYFTSLVFIKVSDQCSPGRQPGFISWHHNLKDVRISVCHCGWSVLPGTELGASSAGSLMGHKLVFD